MTGDRGSSMARLHRIRISSMEHIRRRSGTIRLLLILRYSMLGTGSSQIQVRIIKEDVVEEGTREKAASISRIRVLEGSKVDSGLSSRM